MSSLYRSSDEKVLAGVCAGLAHRLDLNVSGLRAAVAILSVLMTGCPVLVYLVLWAVLKERPTRNVVDV